MSHKRETVIAEARALAKVGQFPRFFCIAGELWECCRGEYLPDVGERSWFAERIEVHKLSSGPDFPERDGMRYRWLRDHALEVLIPGPVVCAADKWGELATVNNRHITIDGHDLDAEIDAAMNAYEASNGRP